MPQKTPEKEGRGLFREGYGDNLDESNTLKL